MQKKLSNSVKIKYLNGEAVIEQLKRCAVNLKRSNPNVLGVILFGSLVHGDYGPRSDADLLIILASDERRRIDRIPEFLHSFSEVIIPVDVFPLTTHELQQEVVSDNLHIKRILKEGMEIG